MKIIISPGGKIRFIYDDALAGLLNLGKAVTKRASHVEPGPDGWTADLSPVGGPFLGPFALRSEALAAEKAWLEEKEVPEVLNTSL